MNQGASEHIKEAAEVVSQYCDIIAVRAFAGLVDKDKDNAETVLPDFKICYRPHCEYGRLYRSPASSLGRCQPLPNFKRLTVQSYIVLGSIPEHYHRLSPIRL
jgi:hypothetical protein